MLLHRSHAIQHSYPRKENLTPYHMEVPLKFLEHEMHKDLNLCINRIAWCHEDINRGIFLVQRQSRFHKCSPTFLSMSVHLSNRILNFLIYRMRKGEQKYLI